MAKIAGNTLRGHLETMILAVLEKGAGHGFDILKRLEQAGCGELRLKEGSLYPALYRLEEAGFIKGDWEGENERPRGPRRRVYHVNKKGKKELAKRREDWTSFVSIVGAILEATP